MTRRIYLMNLLRSRLIFWSGMSAAIPGGIAYALGWPAWLVWTIFVVSLLIAVYHWLGVQMACRHCGALLRVTRLTGPQTRCHKCGGDTDAVTP